MTKTVNEVLKAVELPDGVWEKTITKVTGADPIYRVLFGGAVAALKAIEYLEQASGGQREHVAQDPATLYNDLLNCMNRCGRFDWDCTSSMLDWSIGYFVNRAEHNIMSAFDRSLTFWVAHRLRLDPCLPSTEDIWAFGWFTTRLTVLRPLVANSAIDQLEPVFGNTWPLDDQARSKINFQSVISSERWPGHQIPTALDEILGSLPLSPAQCLFIVVDHTNAFKHRVSALLIVRGALSAQLGWLQTWRIETVIVIKALRLVSDLWRAAIDDAIELQKSPT